MHIVSNAETNYTLYMKSTECVNGDVRTSIDPIGRAAVVQFCHQGIWRSICRDGDWGEVEANLVCNQLGYGDTGIGTSQ